ncbi:hypothetical protein COLO4_15444 [Corchorus olitorius]|uniref:Uncharacterized protein n=1 Tax=Corchorus olitorius TaxID=93759 RepID=A0A1R3JN80_9ROSI|nr:hypothetical protein COLO4_15444 [Corchorus olitorius]
MANPKCPAAAAFAYALAASAKWAKLSPLIRYLMKSSS